MESCVVQCTIGNTITKQKKKYPSRNNLELFSICRCVLLIALFIQFRKFDELNVGKKRELECCVSNFREISLTSKMLEFQKEK